MLGEPRQGRDYEHRLPAAIGILVGVATMPLSSRAKLLMSIQAVSALIVSLLVIAKAVGGLK